MAEKVRLSEEAVTVGDLEIPLENRGLFWVDYPRSPGKALRGYAGVVVSAIDVLNGGTKGVGRSAFAGKIVLIGRTDRGSGEFFNTPAGQLPSVELFAYILNTLLRKSFFHSIGPMADALILLGLVLLTAAITLWFRVVTSLFVVAEETVGMAILAAVLFGRHHAIMNFPLAFMGIILSFTFTQIYTLFIRERELSTLGIYMSSEVRRKILDSPQQVSVRGERKVLTVLFADIRGFRRFCHRLDPAATVALLNSYFTAMVEVITRPGHDGTIDKLVGDGIVAVFGDPLPYPDHAKRAVIAAIAMQKRFAEVKRTWVPYVKKMAPKYDMTKMSLGIGVATGEVVVGNVGAPSHGFMSYTVIGDPANRAAGLQDIAEGGQILFDGDTMEQVGNSVQAKDLGEHTVKGLKMHIYQIGPERA
jgi:adenylate cyclase